MITHSTTLTQTNGQGHELWTCTQCEHRFVVLSWQPLKRVIIHQSAPNVAHAGGKGGLQMGAVTVTAPATAPVLSPEDRRWLEAQGITGWSE